MNQAPKKPRKQDEELVRLSRPLPHDSSTQIVILSMFLEQESLLDEPFEEAWFYPPNCPDTVIYQAMKKMRGEKRPVQYISLLAWLKDHDLMGRAGGDGYVSELMTVAPSTTHFGYYVGILKEKHLERTVILAGVEVIESAYSHDLETIASTATQQLTKISEAVRGKRERGMSEQLEEWMDTWHDIRSGKKESAMPTRWGCWNNRLMGIRPGYTVISGPRGSGKSTAAQNILTDACILKGRAGLSVNYELPVRMVLNRIISDLGGIPGVHLFCPDITRPDKTVETRISQCLARIADSKLKIVHDVRMGLEDVSNLARAMKAEHGNCMVLVDYVQIAPPPRMNSDGNREQEVAKNSGILRSLSKEIDDTVMGLSQLNRDGTTRESSAIENDADDVYRVERYKQPDGSTSEGGILVFKNRSGPEGFHLSLTLDGERYRFIEKGSSPVTVQEDEL